MKKVLFSLLLVTLSIPVFSQLTYTLSKHPDTISHWGNYYITAVTDNRHTNQNTNTVGRLYGVIGSQKIILKHPATAFYNFYNAVHPKSSTDTAAIVVSIDSIMNTNIPKALSVTFVTTLSLSFISQSTGQVLCSFTGREEGKTALLYARLYSAQIESLLLRALRHFETSTSQGRSLNSP